MYAMSDVPKVNRPADPRVVEVRFKPKLPAVKANMRGGDTYGALRKLFWTIGHGNNVNIKLISGERYYLCWELQQRRCIML